MAELNIITTRPVTYSNACGCEGTSSLDGSSKPDDILNFQKWLSVSDMALKDESIKNIKQDGKWGSKTAKLYKSFGKKYEESIKKKGEAPKDPVDKNGNPLTKLADPKEDLKTKQADKRIKYLKIGGIVLGGLAAIGLIVWVVKSNK